MCFVVGLYRGIIGYPSPCYKRYNSGGVPPVFSVKNAVFTGGIGCYNYVKTAWLALSRVLATRTHIAMVIFFAIGLRHCGYTACNVYYPPPISTISISTIGIGTISISYKHRN